MKKSCDGSVPGRKGNAMCLASRLCEAKLNLARSATNSERFGGVEETPVDMARQISFGTSFERPRRATDEDSLARASQAFLQTNVLKSSRAARAWRRKKAMGLLPRP